MNTTRILTLAVVAALALAGTAPAACEHGFTLQVLLDGAPRSEYHARGAVYVEAVRGRNYMLRITNPLPVRVAVALAVDGLNTIDAKHGDARTAPQWVLGPYETLEIAGWQTSGSEARRFLFTGERSSYGAWLGQTDNLGVIEAVFYREKPSPIPVQSQVIPPGPVVEYQRGLGPADGWGAPGGVAGDSACAPSAPGNPLALSAMTAPSAKSMTQRLSDEYAATGIGERTRHEIEWVHFETEEKPTARIRIRYEFHEQLARLGVLPPVSDPLDRREAARGFSGPYCPDPSLPRQ